MISTRNRPALVHALGGSEIRFPMLCLLAFRLDWPQKVGVRDFKVFRSALIRVFKLTTL
jgi:hypothetical protein